MRQRQCNGTAFFIFLLLCVVFCHTGMKKVFDTFDINCHIKRIVVYSIHLDLHVYMSRWSYVTVSKGGAT